MAAEVERLINGMVLLKIPDELAWSLFIEGKDAAKIGAVTMCGGVPALANYMLEDYDLAILRQYLELFQTSSLSKLLGAYFAYVGISSEDDDEDEGKTPREPDPEVEYAEIMIVRLQYLSERLSFSLLVL